MTTEFRPGGKMLRTDADRGATRASATHWTVYVAIALIAGVAVMGIVLSTTSLGNSAVNELPGITTAHPSISAGDPME